MRDVNGVGIVVACFESGPDPDSVAAAAAADAADSATASAGLDSAREYVAPMVWHKCYQLFRREKRTCQVFCVFASTRRIVALNTGWDEIGLRFAG